MANPRNATTSARGRTYRWRDEEFTSVTTIIGGGIPKPALTSWAAKSVAEYVAENIADVATLTAKDKAAAIDLCKGSPWRQRDKAADLGSRCHEAAEAHVLGQPQPEWEQDVAPYMAAFRQFLDDFRPAFQQTEATVYSREHSYAGTLDTIVYIDGVAWLIDYKTGKGVYGETALQLAAYRFAEFIGAPDGSEVPMPPVERCGVLHLTPKGYELIPVEADEVAFEFFLAAQEIHSFVGTHSCSVLGPPEPVPTREAVA